MTLFDSLQNNGAQRERINTIPQAPGRGSAGSLQELVGNRAPALQIQVISPGKAPAVPAIAAGPAGGDQVENQTEDFGGEMNVHLLGLCVGSYRLVLSS
jgi:hypothetical protein